MSRLFAASCRSDGESSFLLLGTHRLSLSFYLLNSCSHVALVIFPRHFYVPSQETALLVGHRFVLFHSLLLTALGSQLLVFYDKSERGCKGAAAVMGKEQLLSVLVSSRESTWIHLKKYFTRSKRHRTAPQGMDSEMK